MEPFKRERPGGAKPLDFRTVLNGILCILKTGCQWELLPPAYGSKSAVHEHFQRWGRAGVFAEICRLCAEEYGEVVGYEWTWQSMDGSLVQAPVRQAVCLAEEGLGRMIISIGHNPATNHPRMMGTLREASGRGVPIVVFNPLRERGLERRCSRWTARALRARRTTTSFGGTPGVRGRRRRSAFKATTDLKHGFPAAAQSLLAR